MSNRPTILDLYGIDARDFIGMPHEVVTQNKIDAILKKKKELTKELMDRYNSTSLDYEKVAGINATLKYLNKAYDGLMADMEEMMADMEEMTAEREKNESDTEECLIFWLMKKIFKGRE